MIRNRKSNRLKNFDYTKDGYYFITICTKNRVEWFGDIQTEKNPHFSAQSSSSRLTLQLSWSHYRKLITVRDKNERKKGVVENLDPEGDFLLDLGFRIRKNLEEIENLKLAKGDCLQASNNNSLSGYKMVCKDGPVFNIDEIDWEVLWEILKSSL